MALMFFEKYYVICVRISSDLEERFILAVSLLIWNLRLIIRKIQIWVERYLVLKLSYLCMSSHLRRLAIIMMK